MSLTGRLLGYVWLGVLGGVLACSVLIADRRTQRIEEHPFGCDSFGYLQTAQEIRQGHAARVWPRFNLQASHTQLLVEFMQARQVPLEMWEEIVGPHAYHYFPKSELVGVQYPPGTGLLLAIFPQGQALHHLDRMVIGIFLATGLLVLILAALNQAWLSAGIVILALHLGLEILGRIGNSSFSINAVLAPLLLSTLCLFWALSFQADGTGALTGKWLIAFFSGLLLGFAFLVRLPVLFLVPGTVVLLWPAELRAWRHNRLIAFGLGVLLAGVLPLAAFQSRLVGAWYLPTYGRNDASSPTLGALKANVSFYLGSGNGSADNWALIVVAVSSLALLWWPGRLGKEKGRVTSVTRKRLVLAAMLMWGTSTAYFLTHKVAIHFYAIPATFATVLLLALGTFSLEITRTRIADKTNKGIRTIALVLVMVAPGFIAGLSVWRNYLPAEEEAKPRQFVLPAELAAERAWVWSDMLSGTLWYYNRKPAHKIQFTGPETRALLFEFVFDRGEPQYLIRDNDSMQSLQDEITALGGTFEDRGAVDGYPYFLIHWPPNGPRKGARAVIPANNSAGELQ